jgi:HEAT repeat protein
MTRRKRANEIQELIGRLGSPKQVEIDSASARLSVLGARAVEGLIDALGSDDNRLRGHAIQLLAMIGDPRGRGPLTTLLRDEALQIREKAAHGLGRFPSLETVTSLRRLLRNETRTEVRLAAVQALIELYEAGQEEALREILEILFNLDEPAEIRLAACSILSRLRASVRKGILAKLEKDAVKKVSSFARRLQNGDSETVRDEPCMEDLLADLANSDYSTWNEALYRLSRKGIVAVNPLIEEMSRRSDNPEYCTRVGMVLRALGPRRGRPIGEALGWVEEPLPLLTLVEVIGSLKVNALTYRLKDLLERDILKHGQAPRPGLFHRVRAKAHLELARIGSRVAIQELRDDLRRKDHRVEPEILVALEMIGQKDELLDLIRIYGREDTFIRQRIATAVQKIMRREKIRPSHAIIQGLSATHRKSLETILGRKQIRANRPSNAM